jgi:hypothetical protein
MVEALLQVQLKLWQLEFASDNFMGHNALADPFPAA